MLHEILKTFLRPHCLEILGLDYSANDIISRFGVKFDEEDFHISKIQYLKYKACDVLFIYFFHKNIRALLTIFWGLENQISSFFMWEKQWE